jgi:hypothetical protein
LPADERDFLLGWRDVRQGIFEVTGRDGDLLLTENLIDDLPYRIRTNAGASIFDRMPAGAFLSTRVVPVRDDWLISGASALYGADRRDDVLAVAATTAAERPDLVFRNPLRLARGWEMQRAQHATFVEHFGADEITAKPGEAADLMQGFWTAYAGRPTAGPQMDLDWLNDGVESIGIIYDELARRVPAGHRGPRPAATDASA